MNNNHSKSSYLSKIIVVCLLFAGFISTASAQQILRKTGQVPDKYIEAVQASRGLIHSLMLKQDIPGVQVAVSVRGETVWSQGFGYADIENKIPVWPYTKMRIGSVSKTLTSVALGQLVEAAKLDLDAPVQTYVPYFPKKEHTVTVRQVGGHLAGIRTYRGTEFLSAKHYDTVKEGLQIFMNDSLISEPGTEFHYSSYGWNLLSAVVEGASGRSFIEYMQANVFEPLEMVHTVPDYVYAIINHRTNYYITSSKGKVANAPFVDNSYKWAGGGFLSTAEDLLKFGNAMLGSSFLDRETIDVLWTSQTTSGGEKTGCGIGWFSGDDDNRQHWVGHSGGSIGGTTEFVVFPKQKVVVAIIANLSEVDYNNIQLTIAGYFMED